MPTWSTAGSRAAVTWLGELGIRAPGTRWYVEIALDVRDLPAPVEYDERVDTRFHVEIYSEEWGYMFCHAGRLSRVRVTDIPFVHGRDDYHLLPETPALDQIATLIRRLESQHGLAFRRDLALIHTDLANAELAIRAWVARL